MSVEFNEEGSGFKNKYQSQSISNTRQTPKMMRFLIDKKIVKDEKSAGILLLSIILICFIITGYFVFLISKPEKIEYNLSPEVLDSLPANIKKTIYESQK
jgi:hypothetical protein